MGQDNQRRPQCSEIHTSLDEIIDTLKKLKDHHQDIVRQDIVTVTVRHLQEF